jgi:hypothetical protein
VLTISISDKHKHKTLTISAKVEIIKKLEIGKKLNNLAKEYGVEHAMIYDIRKNGELKINLIHLIPVIHHFW